MFFSGTSNTANTLEKGLFLMPSSEVSKEKLLLFLAKGNHFLQVDKEVNTNTRDPQSSHARCRYYIIVCKIKPNEAENNPDIQNIIEIYKKSTLIEISDDNLSFKLPL